MFAFSGRIIAAERLESNYLSLILRREREGLLGDTIQVLVPTLVELRDGVPEEGQWAWVEALPAQAGDLARGLSGFEYVAFRLMDSKAPAPRVGDPGAGPADAVLGGSLDRQLLLP
ncbi:hypothetical protein H0Z60_09615 [Ectothiorhodospiraceae bacterium WFHF3C12]|nr:hypothetical protein [Ectothiorhodospiraceae bacterium WFHF3C12]